MNRFVWPLLACLFWISPAFAETYWLPRVQYLPTETIYTYELKVPEYFKPWLLESTRNGGGQVVTKTINGQSYTFVQQFFSWDTDGSSPAKTGQIRIDDAAPRYQSNLWKDNAALKDDTAVIAGLDAFVLPRERNERWHSADVLALRTDSDQPPGLTFSEAVPEGDQIKARMRQAAETTIPGQFFPDEVEIPADMAAMRREILAWGNLGRRDPAFRKDNKWANDFSGSTVQTGPNKLETLYKTNQQPPYFNDLVLHPQLNEACQFMAEYYAKTNGNAQMPDGAPKHNAPGVTYQGADMSTVDARRDHFAPGVGTSGEGLGGGGPADAFPESWMRSETHYRPWFNIDFDNKSVGLGAAKTSNGWFFCMLGGTELPEGAAAPQGVAVSTGGAGVEGLTITSATYGENCGAPSGNVTSFVGASCSGRDICDYKVNPQVTGDPARGCQKDLRIAYTCSDGEQKLAFVAAEASRGQAAALSCAPVAGSGPRISVNSASYGQNCNAAPGNVTAHIANACNGKDQCAYTIDVKALGDPAQGCQKDYRVAYACSDGRPPRVATAAAEAGRGSVVTLSCQ